jgi:hypothetical protein
MHFSSTPQAGTSDDPLEAALDDILSRARRLLAIASAEDVHGVMQCMRAAVLDDVQTDA